MKKISSELYALLLLLLKLIFRILKDKIDGLDEYILDGFLRNLKQAEMLERVVKIDKMENGK